MNQSYKTAIQNLTNAIQTIKVVKKGVPVQKSLDAIKIRDTLNVISGLIDGVKPYKPDDNINKSIVSLFT